MRCHVAGWGKDEFTGNFQFIQHKVDSVCMIIISASSVILLDPQVDIPLMDDFRCNAALQLALNRRQQGEDIL